MVLALVLTVTPPRWPRRPSTCGPAAMTRTVTALPMSTTPAAQAWRAPFRLSRRVSTWSSSGTVYVRAGAYVLTVAMNVNKTGITLDGDGLAQDLQVSGTGDRFNITAAGVICRTSRLRRPINPACRTFRPLRQQHHGQEQHHSRPVRIPRGWRRQPRHGGCRRP